MYNLKKQNRDSFLFNNASKKKKTFSGIKKSTCAFYNQRYMNY